MPQGCVVPNCTSRYGTAEKVSMYRFPLAKPKLVARWLKAIKKPNWEPTKNSRICCRHFEEDCFWSYNGRNALTPYAIPTKFDAIPREPEPIHRVNRQHFQNVRKPWYMPPARTKDLEPALVTQDIVYIKTEPDLYLCENEFTIKEEPQSDMETEINSFDVGQIKIEDNVGSGELGPLPIVFPVVKDEIKEEPEDTTYSLPPSVFARLGSPPIFEERTQNLNVRKVKKPTYEHPTTLRSPKKQCIRKRRRRIREEGLLSDHTYVKFKLGNKVKAGSVGEALNHEKVCTTTPKYSHVSVQCEEKMFLQSDIRMKTQENANANNCMLGLELEVGGNGHINNMSKKCGTGMNSKKANTKTNHTSNTRRISKFPSVTFSNSKCKNGLVLNSKQRKYSVCKKLLKTFKNDLGLNSGKQEVSTVEDFNKENSLCLDKCYNAVISRDLEEDPLHGLDIGQITEAQNECLNIGDVKKNSSNVFFGIASTRDKLNKLGTSIETEYKYESGNKYIPKLDKKFSESLSLISSNGDQTRIACTSVKQNNANNLTRRHHRSRKKKKLWSLGKQRNLIRSVKVKQALQNNKMISGGVTSKVANVGNYTSDCETKLCSVGHINIEENFVKEEVEERHLCVLCEEMFPCQESLRIHVARHCQESAYACLYCAKTFGDDECLQSHIETHVLHKCVLCCAELPSKSALCEHVLAHFGGAVLKCEHCPKTFYGTKLYEEHQLLHAVVSEYVCKICEKVVTTEIEYFEHMKSHMKRLSFLNSRNQTCTFSETSPVQNGIASMQVNNKTIKVKDEYESIDEKNIERRLVCAICNELFVNETDYKEHVLRHKKNQKSRFGK